MNGLKWFLKINPFFHQSSLFLFPQPIAKIIIRSILSKIQSTQSSIFSLESNYQNQSKHSHRSPNLKIKINQNILTGVLILEIKINLNSHRSPNLKIKINLNSHRSCLSCPSLLLLLPHPIVAREAALWPSLQLLSSINNHLRSFENYKRPKKWKWKGSQSWPLAFQNFL